MILTADTTRVAARDPWTTVGQALIAQGQETYKEQGPESFNWDYDQDIKPLVSAVWASGNEWAKLTLFSLLDGISVELNRDGQLVKAGQLHSEDVDWPGWVEEFLNEPTDMHKYYRNPDEAWADFE